MLWFANLHPENFFWPGIITLAVLVFGIKIISGKFVHAVLPAILAVGSLLFLPLIDSPGEAKAFMVLSAGVFYFGILAGYRLSQYEKDKTAKAMYNLVAFASLFCWLAGSYGWYLNIEMPVWLVMTVFAAAAFPISYMLFQFEQFGVNRHQKILYSIFLSYLMAGTVWLQDFWPFGYLTTGVVALIIYYSGWDVIRNHFLNKLTYRKVLFDALFLIGSVGLILMSTKWYPVT